MRSVATLFLAMAGLACAQQIAPDLQAGFYHGRQVYYRVVDGLAVAEGDILLGRPEDLQLSGKANEGREAIARPGSRARWTNGIIPYVVDDAVVNPSRVEEAVRQWNDSTPIRLVPRSGEPNYVRFVRAEEAGLCSSFVGMSGGAQPINLGDSCSVGATVHEIGHAVGLWHEQSRQDRDFYLRIRYPNIDKREWSQYSQRLSDGEDVGGYDFSSVMHYTVGGFSRAGKPTMETVPPGIPIGQRGGLSPADIDAVRRLYGATPTGVTIATNPANLPVIVDGERITSTRTFDWTPGSRHTLAFAPQESGNTRLVFGRWSNDGPATQTVVAGPDTTVYIAHYARHFRPALAAGSGGTIHIRPESPDGFYPEGTELELTPIAQPGRQFAGWSGFGLFGVHGISPEPLSFVLRDAEVRYTAAFTAQPLTRIVASAPGLKVKVDDREVTLPAFYAWTPGSEHRLEVAALNQSTLSDTQRHQFRGWSVGSDPVQVVRAGDQTTTITADFRSQALVTVGVFPSRSGSVRSTPFNGDGYYDLGSTLDLMAAASDPYLFTGWTGDLAGLNGSVTVSDYVTTTANFAIPGQVTSQGVVSAASYLGGGVAPGQVVALFGLQVGPADFAGLELTPSRSVATLLAGTRVLFDSTPAPLIYVAPNQLAAVVPYSVAGRATTRVQVLSGGRATNTVTLPVVASAPGLFTANASGTGQGAILNQDGSSNSSANPASKGSVVVLYGTGEGVSTPQVADGTLVGAVLPRPVLPVKVRIGGRDAVVEYAGGAPSLVAGVFQVNVRIPDDAPAGNVPISVRVGEASSPAVVTVAVR